MKRLVLSAIFFSKLLISQSFVDYPVAPGNYNSICFLDSLNGWVCGNNGSIMHTTNGGIDWISQSSSTSLNLYKIKFANLQVGWAVGDNGVIIHTVDGGSQWSLQNSGVQYDLIALSVTDSLNAWILEKQYTSKILHTSDGGISWITQQTYPDNKWFLTSCMFLNNDTGYVCGNWYSYTPPNVSLGTVQYTIDGGNHWYSCLASYDMYRAVSFIDRNNGWVVGDNDSQMKTTNAGTTWSNITSLYNRWLNEVFFVTKDSGWVLQYFTYDNKIHFTSDGGDTWVDQTIPSDEALNEIFFINNTRGWAVGPNHIFYTNDAGKNWSLNPVGVLSADNNNTSFNYSLYQNYPNPFNPSTCIQYAISSRQYVTLKVYDVLGNEVTTLVNEYRDAGTYETEFNAGKLSSGVYYYQLKAGEFIQTKKMILLK